MKIFFSIIILLFTISVPAQKKVNAILFDTFEDSKGDAKIMDKKIDAFARKLNGEPQSTKGYIVEYVESTVHSFYQLARSRSNAYNKQVKENINRIYRFSEGRIIFAFGGLNRDAKDNRREFAKIEFWLVPQGAELPENRAEDDGDWFMSCECPTISLQGNKNIYDVSEPLTFSVELQGGEYEEITYKWSVSGGKIISGQGTDQIKIDLTEIKSEKINIKVEIEGFCESCPPINAEELLIIH